MPARIGIPGALFYFTYYPFWRTFFEKLGAQVITSGRTNKNMLDYGVREALADTCIPVKLYFGHVLSLKEKVDYLFVPRVVCLNGETTYCPKFLGLPDMIRHALTNIPPLIDIRLDIREGWGSLLHAYCEAGCILGANWRQTAQAYWKAVSDWKRFNRLLQSGWQPPEAIEILANGAGHSFPQKSKTLQESKTGLTFAVLGYPYTIHDQYISVGLLNKLRKMGIRPVTAENLPPRRLTGEPYLLDKRLFWTFSELSYKAMQYLLKQGKVDGIIHLTAFGCGPDAMLDKYMEMLAAKYRTIPFMSLTIDEHSAQAGMTTRLEAFADMVRRKKGDVSRA